MKNDGKFQILFEDKTQFIGNLFNKDWGKIPDQKRIKEIVFTFGNKSIKMENFQEYNLTFETWAIVGGKSKIVNITLAGRKDSESILIIFDCQRGKILRKEAEKFKELPWISSTWKKGIVGETAKDYHG